MRLLNGVLLVIAAMFIATASADPVQWPVGEGGNDYYYDLIEHPEGMTWYDARDEAPTFSHLGVPGHLATITSAEEGDFIVANLLLASPSAYYWLGGLQPDGSQEPDGGWEWLFGEVWNYTNWNPGEPNNGGGYENVLSVYGAGPDLGTWNDVGGSMVGPYGGYVIEYEVPEPATISLLTAGVLLLARRRR